MSAHGGDPDRLEFVVEPADAGKRLDKVVQRHLIGYGRRAVAELFARRAVRADGRLVNKGDLSRAGEAITILLSDLQRIAPEPFAPLKVVLATHDVVVVSKPAGQPTAPVILGETGTLAGALLGRYPELSSFGHKPREPGLLHRLDTQTSGLVVAARHEAAFRTLSRALSEGRLEKRYLAIVREAGLADFGVVDAPLAPSAKQSRRVQAVTTGGRPAVTRFNVVSRKGPLALVECVVSHAYRHQIRAHLALLGHPILGDRLYGGPEAPELGARHALHASYVAWAGDLDVPPFEAEDPLPADLAALLLD